MKRRAWMAGIAVGAVSALGIVTSAEAQQAPYPGSQSSYPGGYAAGATVAPQYGNAQQLQQPVQQQPFYGAQPGVQVQAQGPAALAAPVQGQPIQQPPLQRPIAQPHPMMGGQMGGQMMGGQMMGGQMMGGQPMQGGIAGNVQPGAAESCTLSDVSQGAEDRAAEQLARLDANHDGLISRPELMQGAQQLAGGIFFRADQNHDGRLTPSEAHAARADLMSRRPFMGLVSVVANEAASSPGAKQLAGYLDVNNDKTLDMGELNRAVVNGVDAVFSFADTNHDDQLSVGEINNAVSRASADATKAAFNAADTNNNGVVTRDEFAAAMQKPEQAIFASMDKNHDGVIDPQEAMQAEKSVGRSLGVQPLTEADLLSQEQGQTGIGQGITQPPMQRPELQQQPQLQPQFQQQPELQQQPPAGPPLQQLPSGQEQQPYMNP